MKRELLSKAFSDIDEAYITEAYRPVLEDTSASPERTVHMKKKHIICFPFAAALIFVLGITVYAVWSIHAARQEEIKSNLKIEENDVSSYMEYDLSKG